MYNKVVELIKLYLCTKNYFISNELFIFMFLETVKIYNFTIQNVCEVDDPCRVWLQIRAFSTNSDNS